MSLPAEHGPRLLRVDAARCTAADLRPAAVWLASGRVVAFPTDTFYGLAADPSSEAAVQMIYAVKGRDARAALPLVAASAAQVAEATGALSGLNARLARAFWPGPLSLIFDSPPGVAAAVHGGQDSVAIRVPAHAVAASLAAAFGGLVTATSANRSGAPAASTADALGDLASDPRVFIIDGGATPGGAPSTMVDARGARPVLIREGAIAWNRVLESAWPPQGPHE